jgi:tartrate dehydratase beta subunit/fumarate hydratase class I family protein
MDTAKQLGAVAGPLVNKAGLNGALAKLGMKPETVSKFAPTVTDYLGKIGGDSAKNLLASALK